MSSIKGQFTPNEDGIFNHLLAFFHEKSNTIAYSAFDKLLQIMYMQGSLVQTDFTRVQVEITLNILINIARSQNYDHTAITLKQLVEIYFGF